MEILFEDVSFTYQAGTPLAHTALKNINLTIEPQSFTAIVGKTGSGKSTLVRHLNALLKPTEGIVRLSDQAITPDTTDHHLKRLRKKVGTVFQFPEAQLFEQTVAEDIAFGPKNYGASDAEADQITRDILPLVDFDASYLDRSPFDLSGGQQRRVAIAGVLALEPEVLVLDEPTAGLDPQGQLEMMAMFSRLNKEQKTTIILVTHRMEHVAQYADDVVVLENGTRAKQGAPREIFSDAKLLARNDLNVPNTTDFAQKLEQAYGWSFEKTPITPDELAQALKHYFQIQAGDLK